MWMAFERQVLALGGDQSLILAAQTRRRMFEAWTIIPDDYSHGAAKYLHAQRQGKLVWAAGQGDEPQQAGPSPGGG